MKFINITQHPVRIRVNTENKEASPDPQDIILEPCGTVARVSVTQAVVRKVSGVPVVKTIFGDPVDLPDPQENVIYIGSTPLAQKAALVGRHDVLSPNTAPKQDIRYPDGHPQAGRTFAVFNFQEF